LAPGKDINTSKRGHWYGRPYYFFGDYLQNKYGCRILKLPIDSGLSCPNRDPVTGSGGCVFCGDDGSASPTTSGYDDIAGQMEAARSSFRRSDRSTRYIAYFQAFTNTNAPPRELKQLYDQAIAFPGIMGLMIGTRPDCLSDAVLDLIASYRRDGFELWLEIGMQSSHDRSLNFLNRRHSHDDTLRAVERAARRGIPLCAHLILGIPGESWKDMMATAHAVSSIALNGVKIHHLHVIRGTRLEELYSQGNLRLMELREYVSTACDFLERLRDDIIIHRLMGDRQEDSLVAPRWGLHKGTVLKAIEDEFARRGTCQSFLCEC
jgi:radical SAM protein (TIGR01212 family)